MALTEHLHLICSETLSHRMEPSTSVLSGIKKQKLLTDGRWKGRCLRYSPTISFLRNACCKQNTFASIPSVRSVKGWPLVSCFQLTYATSPNRKTWWIMCWWPPHSTRYPLATASSGSPGAVAVVYLQPQLVGWAEGSMMTGRQGKQWQLTRQGASAHSLS